MPIFRKNGKSVFFAHIPKTAGTSIYVLFLRNGWSLSNFTPSVFPGSTFERLKSEFGIEDIPKEGRRWGYRGTLQHAPASVWRHWPRCDESFAIVRHPVDRYISALRYRHQTFSSHVPWDDFLTNNRAKLQRPFRRVSRLYDGHFRPQVSFVTHATQIFRFEEDWGRALCDRYDLDGADIPFVNRSAEAPITLSPEDRAWITRYYRRDFTRFGYEKAASRYDLGLKSGETPLKNIT